MSFSVIILTYNEASNLESCLDSIPWCDDIVVIDSYSTDNTVEIAKQRGARVFFRKFDNFGAQRVFAINEISYKYDWVFHLDADEHFTDALRKECESLIEQDLKSAYMVPSKLMLFGKWVKYAACYPVYQMRFHKLGEVGFEQFGHGQKETDAKRGVGFIKNAYEHYSYSKGLADWFEKHNRYSSEEAHVAFENAGEICLKNLFSKDMIARRRALKRISYRLPFRCLLKFLYLFILKGGFLDGKVGLDYIFLNLVYERMTNLKILELKYRKDN